MGDADTDGDGDGEAEGKGETLADGVGVAAGKAGREDLVAAQTIPTDAPTTAIATSAQ